jgi:hypothetical protein
MAAAVATEAAADIKVVSDPIERDAFMQQLVDRTRNFHP